MYELAKFQDGADPNGKDYDESDSPILLPKKADNIILAGRTESFNKIKIIVDEDRDPVAQLTKEPSYPEMGIIQGVLLPFLQSNMIGAILFLRLPYVTGQAGVILTSVMFVLCVVSTSLTVLSLSALASNGKFNKSGGIYQLVSRNLGVELGGATGLLFYLGKALAASMYCLGASEAFLTGLGLEDSFPWNHEVIALGLCLFLCILVHHIETKYIDLGTVIFLFIALLTIAFFTIGGFAFRAGSNYGNLSEADRVLNDNVYSVFKYDDTMKYQPTFMNMLALYYPSVTGIMTGSNRPGKVAKVAGMLLFVIEFCRNIP